MNASPLILAVDDDPGILQFIKIELTTQDFGVITAQDGPEALRLVEEQRPALVLLDVIMPGMGGLEVLREIRAVSTVPIILLTARRSGSDKIRGLEMGADDYLVKPFNPDELSARVRAILRRSGERPTDREGNVVRNGSIVIDLDRRVVTRSGESLTLTRTEWQLLQYLAQNADRVIPNLELLGRVWGPEYASELPYLRVWVSKLRNKLRGESSESDEVIETVPGVGYMLRSTPEETI